MMPLMILITLVKVKDVGFLSSNKQEESTIEMWINASRITAIAPLKKYTSVTMKEDRTDSFIVKESPAQIRQKIREEYKKMVE